MNGVFKEFRSVFTDDECYVKCRSCSVTLGSLGDGDLAEQLERLYLTVNDHVCEPPLVNTLETLALVTLVTALVMPPKKRS